MKTTTILALAACAALGFATAPFAADGPPAPRKERVAFAKGASSATIKGTLKGGGDVDYVVRAAAGQTLDGEARRLQRAEQLQRAAARFCQRRDVLEQHDGRADVQGRPARRRRLCDPRLPRPGRCPAQRDVEVHADRGRDRQGAAATVRRAGREGRGHRVPRDGQGAVRAAVPAGGEVVRRGCGPPRQRRHGDLRGDRARTACSGASCSCRASRSRRTRWNR